jgi:hypothetical protein
VLSQKRPWPRSRRASWRVLAANSKFSIFTIWTAIRSIPGAVALYAHLGVQSSAVRSALGLACHASQHCVEVSDDAFERVS